MDRFEAEFKQFLKWNPSTLLIMKPITGLGIGSLSKFGLINSYLQDELSDLDGDNLFVLFKPTDMDNFEKMADKYVRRTDNFLQDYDYEGGYIVLTYSIPTGLLDDFELFKKGKYSKMSVKVRSNYKFQVVIDGKKEKSFQYMVFNKDSDFRYNLENYLGVTFSQEDELWEAPGDNEILKIEEIHDRITKSINSPERGTVSVKSRKFSPPIGYNPTD
jgi:hypothetical protein